MFYSMSSKQAFGQLRTAAGGGVTGGGEWQLLPNTSDWYGRFRIVPNRANDYLIDRDKQRSNEEYTGIAGIHTQDQAITESMGLIFDRAGEHVGASDAMVIRTRRRLLGAVRALAEKGETPPGVDQPEAYRKRSGQVFLPAGADWLEATKHLREPGIPQTA
jgi:phthalate 4,5-dioxygenase